MLQKLRKSLRSKQNTTQSAPSSGSGSLSASTTAQHELIPGSQEAPQTTSTTTVSPLPPPIAKGRNYGTKVLYDGGTKACVDIVFVHGLTGNAYTTWRHEETDVHWPSALLKQDIPNARILSFGYDADIVNFFGPASNSRLTNHAESLLGTLVRERTRNQNTEHRAIIFVAHSLGGLITEQALTHSKNGVEGHLKQVADNTIGIVFLGVPHCGADLAAWAMIGGRMTSLLKKTNKDILGVLSPNSEILHMIENNFHMQLRQRKDAPIEITCFFEELGVTGIGEIVPQASAKIDGYNLYGIHANHMDMTKFSSRTDPGYDAILGEIQRWMKTIDQKESSSSSTDPASVKLLNLLSGTTCRNYISRQEYLLSVASFFRSEVTVKRFVLWGTGGMGKTQIALEYARTRSLVDPVFWIRCEKSSSFGQDYGRISSILKRTSQDASTQYDDEEILRRSRLSLEELDNFLLVLDNADDLDRFTGRLPNTRNLSSYLPGKGDVLITTRDPRFLGGFAPGRQGKRVSEFARSDARTLLLSSVPSHLADTALHQDIERLLDQLGDLPLAIAQAAANVNELQIDLCTYISAYDDQKERSQVMQAPFCDNEANDERNKLQSVYITWDISFNFLEKEHKPSAICLQLMTLYHWSAIPLNILASLSYFEAMTRFELRNVIKRLLHLSLIKENIDDGIVEYSLHRVVHEVILDRMKRTSAETLRSMLINVSQHLVDRFPFVAGKDDSSQLFLARYLLPHALRQSQLLDEMEIFNTARARLLQGVGNYLAESKQSKSATYFSSQALDVAGQVWRPDDVSVLYIRRTYAESLVQDAKYAEAETVTLECMNMLEMQNISENLGERNLLLVKLSIAHLHDQSLFGQSKYHALATAYQNTIDLAVRTGFSRRQMRTLQSNVANNLVEIGRSAEARQINDDLIEEITSDSENFKASLTFYGVVLNVRAKILRDLIRQSVVAAEKAQLEAEEFEIRKQVLNYSIEGGGIESLDTWKATNNLLEKFISRSQWVLCVSLMCQILRLALETDICIQGQFLETFSIFASKVLLIFSVVGATPSKSVSGLHRLFDDLLSEQSLTIDDLDIAPAAYNSMGVYLQWSGQFEEAEACLKRLLENEDLSKTNLGGVPHYNLMLAIAQQSGRLAEAFRYRIDHRSAIVDEEVQHGSLEKRIERWETEGQLYAESKSRILTGDSNWESEWCQAHKEELCRAQTRWGWLYEAINPWDETPIVNEEEEADSRIQN